MIDTTCVCCGKHFKKLPDLMAHMTESHTADEVLAAVKKSEQKELVPTTENNDG